MLIQLEHLIEISALLPFGWFSENVCFIVVASYPLPTRSVCELRYGNYPEHVYTWEGYSNRSVSSCVCVSPLNS